MSESAAEGLPDQFHLSELSSQDYAFYDEDGNLIDLTVDQVLEYSYAAQVSNNTDFLDVATMSQSGHFLVVVVFVVMFLAGLIGNLSVVYVVARFREMRNLTMVYLCNMSLAQLLYLTVCLPILGADYVSKEWPLGQIACKVEQYSVGVVKSVTVLSLLAVTVLDRYLAVLSPAKWSQLRSTTSAVLISVGVWVVSLAAMAHRLVVYQTVSQHTTSHQTTRHSTRCARITGPDSRRFETIITFTVLYAIPLCVIAICIIRITLKIRSKSLDLKVKEGPGSSLESLGKSKGYTAVLVALTLVFAIGWLPTYIYSLSSDFADSMAPLEDRSIIVLLFCFGANCLNSIIFCSIRSFRKSILRLFCFSRNKDQLYMKADSRLTDAKELDFSLV